MIFVHLDIVFHFILCNSVKNNSINLQVLLNINIRLDKIFKAFWLVWVIICNYKIYSTFFILSLKD